MIRDTLDLCCLFFPEHKYIIGSETKLLLTPINSMITILVNKSSTSVYSFILTDVLSNNCYLPFKTHKEWKKKTIMIHNTNLNPPVSSQKLANLETLMEQQFTTIGAYWLPLQIDGCTRHFATAAVWLMVVWVALHNWQLQWWSDDHQWKRWSLRIVMSLIHIVFSMLIISFDLLWYGVSFLVHL